MCLVFMGIVEASELPRNMPRWIMCSLGLSLLGFSVFPVRFVGLSGRGVGPLAPTTDLETTVQATFAISTGNVRWPPPPPIRSAIAAFC